MAGLGYNIKYMDVQLTPHQSVQIRILAHLLKSYFPKYINKYDRVVWKHIIADAISMYIKYLFKYASDRLNIDVNTIIESENDDGIILSNLDDISDDFG